MTDLRYVTMQITGYPNDTGHRSVIAVPNDVTDEDIDAAMREQFARLCRRNCMFYLSTVTRNAVHANPGWDWLEDAPVLDVRLDGDQKTPYKIRRGTKLIKPSQPPYFRETNVNGRHEFAAVIRSDPVDTGYRFKLTIPSEQSLDYVREQLLQAHDALLRRKKPFYKPTIVKTACSVHPQWTWQEDYANVEVRLYEKGDA